jgi:hypothetical protein
MLLFVECKKEIHSKIPQGHYSDSNYFRQVKIPFHLVGKDPDDQIVQTQSHERDGEKGEIFGSDVIVLTFKCPKPVPKIVGGSSQDKPA